MRKFCILLVFFPSFIIAQTNYKVDANIGINSGVISSSGNSSDQKKNILTIPLPSLGVSVSYNTQKAEWQTGIQLESTLYRRDIQLTTINAEPIGLARSYDLPIYIALPLLVYPKSLPFGLHTGLKPKFEAGSFAWSDYQGQIGVSDKKFNLVSINYLADFGLDAIVGVSMSVDRVKLILRYERGLFDRVKGKSDYKQYENQFRFVMNIQLYSSD